MKLLLSMFLNGLLLANLNAQVDVRSVSKMQKHISLEKDLKYEYFVSEGDYFCWSEFFTKTISCLNFESDSIAEVKLKKGRGPNEFLMMFGVGIVDGVLYINGTSNLKLIRVDLQTMKYLPDIQLKERVHFFNGSGGRFIGVAVNPGFGNNAIPYLNNIEVAQKILTPLNWTKMNKSPETTQDNFSGYYKMNEKYFLRIGNRMNHLVVADFQNKEISEHTYDEPYGKQEPFDPESGNLAQVLSYYIHDAEIGAKNKLYLLAEGRTKTKRFYKDELTVLDLETMEYIEETIKLPKKFDNIEITEKYFIGFNKEEFSLSFYTYE